MYKRISDVTVCWREIKRGKRGDLGICVSLLLVMGQNEHSPQKLDNRQRFDRQQ
jgi:hypothetical protein